MPVTPALFISHGSPLTVLTEDAYAEALRAAGRGLGDVTAAVVVSAHGLSEEGEVVINGATRPELIYDFRGFPPELYRFQYGCPGDPRLAEEVRARVSGIGFTAAVDGEAGIDHGVWVPLARLFPNADVPVVQVSLPYLAPPSRILELGRALAPLRDQGVVLIGSGGAVHNLRALNWHGRPGAADAWACAFNTWVKERVEAKAIDALVGFQAQAPNPHQAHPTLEHFMPLFFTLGAWRDGERAQTIVDEFQYQSLSMYSFMLS